MAKSIVIHGNVGLLGNLSGTANVAASTGKVTQTIAPQAVLEVVDAMRSHLESLPGETRAEANAALDELAGEAKEERPNQSRLRSGLQKLMPVAGKFGDKVIEAGMKALIDRTLGPG